MRDAACSMQNCNIKASCRGLCKSHYDKARKAYLHEGTQMPPLAPRKIVVPVNHRVCVVCGGQVPDVSFQGYRKQCNSCAYYRYKDKQREQGLLKRYGITSEDYNKMLLTQHGGCAICGNTDPGGRRSSPYFHVDHDHTTGMVRGLLCVGCNLAIGHLLESPETARNLADYLEHHTTK